MGKKRRKRGRKKRGRKRKDEERKKEGGREGSSVGDVQKWCLDDTHVLLILRKMPSKTKEGNKLDQAPDLKQTSPHPGIF